MISELEILDNISLCVIAMCANGTIQTANHASEIMFNQSKNQLIGSSLSKRFLDGEAVLKGIFAAFTEKRSLQFVNIFLRPTISGTSEEVDILVSVLDRDPNVAILSIHKTTHNEKPSNVLKFPNISNVLSHEIKNPLFGIRGAAQLLEVDLKGDQVELTQLIQKESDRVVRLLDQIEASSEFEKVDLELINIHEVIDAARLIAKAGFAKDISIEERYDPSLPSILGNRDYLIQVLINLLKNAVEALSETLKPRITIDTRYGIMSHEMARVAGDARTLPISISIIDNGEGIDGHIEDQVFDPFVTTKINGTGLGLSLVRKLVELHNGSVSYRRISDESWFTIRLPLAQGH